MASPIENMIRGAVGKGLMTLVPDRSLFGSARLAGTSPTNLRHRVLRAAAIATGRTVATGGQRASGRADQPRAGQSLPDRATRVPIHA